jgi:hypothetical protein
MSAWREPATDGGPDSACGLLRAWGPTSGGSPTLTDCAACQLSGSGPWDTAASVHADVPTPLPWLHRPRRPRRLLPTTSWETYPRAQRPYGISGPCSSLDGAGDKEEDSHSVCRQDLSLVPVSGPFSALVGLRESTAFSKPRIVKANRVNRLSGNLGLFGQMEDGKVRAALPIYIYIINWIVESANLKQRVTVARQTCILIN